MLYLINADTNLFFLSSKLCAFFFHPFRFFFYLTFWYIVSITLILLRYSGSCVCRCMVHHWLSTQFSDGGRERERGRASEIRARVCVYVFVFVFLYMIGAQMWAKNACLALTIQKTYRIGSRKKNYNIHCTFQHALNPVIYFRLPTHTHTHIYIRR